MILFLSKIYVNFHRSHLLTESDKRKYKELFAKLISGNDVTSLPILSGIQTKNKLIKGSASTNHINMPTNLSPLIVNDTSINKQGDVAGTATELTGPVQINTLHFTSNDVPITLRPQLPSLINARNTKAHLGNRQVTNVIRRHNGQQITDKII